MFIWLTIRMVILRSILMMKRRKNISMNMHLILNLKDTHKFLTPITLTTQSFTNVLKQLNISTPKLNQEFQTTKLGKMLVALASTSHLGHKLNIDSMKM